MTNEELDRLWFKAMHQSVEEDKAFIRYHFAALVAAEKDKEIELLRADAKRLDWCISVLHSQRKEDSYLVTDTGCGCCGGGKYFDCSISGRDAIDAAIRARGET